MICWFEAGVTDSFGPAARGHARRARLPRRAAPARTTTARSSAGPSTERLVGRGLSGRDRARRRRGRALRRDGAATRSSRRSRARAAMAWARTARSHSRRACSRDGTRDRALRARVRGHVRRRSARPRSMDSVLPPALEHARTLGCAIGSSPTAACTLLISEDQQPWCPDLDGDLRVSTLQTGSVRHGGRPEQAPSASIASIPGAIVRETQQNVRLYTPQYGRIELRAKRARRPAHDGRPLVDRRTRTNRNARRRSASARSSAGTSVPIMRRSEWAFTRSETHLS